MIIIRESNRELHEEQIENGRMLAQENERKKIMKHKIYQIDHEISKDRMREISKRNNDQTISNEIADEERIDDDIFSYAASQGAFEVQQ